jgi:drug/metabolite transporter (DMT)-like permease
LWFSIIVFGAAGSVIRILSDLGAQHPIEGRNAISFCNLLFAGNACALAVLYAVHHKRWTLENLRRLSWQEWCGLFVIAFMANAIAPWLFFLAIENTMVTSVVLVSQIEPPLLLFLAWLVFKDRFGIWSLIGSLLCLTGVALTILLQPKGGDVMIGRGELFAALAAVTYAFSTIVARGWLRGVPIGIFSVFRTGVGTIAFFWVVIYLFGPIHFVDLASPFLWQWMALYGGIIIVSGQLAWDVGVRKSRSIDVSVVTSFAPVAGVLAAFLILGERLGQAHYVGGGVLIAGIALCLLGARKKDVAETAAPESVEERPSALLGAESRTGFKGI